ncbi:hypothetical protein DMENIID0001_006330 [Sergentomyia squamirostris]
MNIVPDDILIDTSGQYVCKLCSEAFPNKDLMDKHRRKEHPVLFICSICSKQFKKNVQFLQHMREHVYCKGCMMEFVSHEKQQEHMKKCKFAKLKKPFSYRRPAQANTNVPSEKSVNEDIQMSSNQSKKSENASVDAAKEDSLKSVVVKLVKEETMITKSNVVKGASGNEDIEMSSNLSETSETASVQAVKEDSLLSVVVKEETMITTENNLKVLLISLPTPSLTCVICSEVLPEKQEDITAHMKGHLKPTLCPDTTTSCQYCKASFPSSTEQREHENVCHKSLKAFEAVSRKKKHEKSSSSSSEMDCTRCKIGFPNISEYSNHLRTVHIAEPTHYTCLVCYKVFSGQDHLQQHKNEQASCNIPSKPVNIERTVPKKKIQVLKKKTHVQYKCSLCLTSYTSLVLVRNHMHLHHTPAVCQHCGKVFTGRSRLRCHIKRHRNKNDRFTKKVFQDQEFKCPKCLIDFSSKTDFDDHLRTVHLPIVEYLCLECSEVFPDKAKLEHHKKIPCSSEVTSKTSNDATMLPCKRCQRVYTSDHVLDLHMRSVHPESSDCSVCRSSFSTRKRLHPHMKTHLLCRVCPQRFHSLVETVKHMRTVHENCDSEKVLPGVFTCSVCSEVCRGVHIFEKHLTKHQVSHQCQYCQMIFPTLHPYREHMNLVHGITEFNMDPSKMKIIPTSDQELRIVLVRME